MIEFLLSLILALTGIARDVDPGLTAIAERRAAETATDATFNHSGIRPGTWEVLAWNVGYADPVTTAVTGWQSSPAHWAILTNPDLTRIGCGHAVGADGRDVFACILDDAAEIEGSARSPKPTFVGSTPTGGATLPNTAMESPDA